MYALESKYYCLNSTNLMMKDEATPPIETLRLIPRLWPDLEGAQSSV